MKIRTLDQIDVTCKTVLLRADLNIPITHGKIEDKTRILRLIPTLKYLSKQQAKTILLSHFDRPKGKFVREMSLAPIVDVLSEVLDGQEILFGVDCIGDSAKDTISKLNAGDIALLENVRFHPGEEENNPDFTAQLAELGDIFINDTFSCSHRDHASIVGLAQALPSAAGLLLQDEITNLETHLQSPQTPIMAIVGGSKVSTKLGLLYNLIERVNFLAIGGAMANTFLAAQGIKVAKSRYEKDLVKKAKDVLKQAQQTGCTILLPEDVVVADDIQNPSFCRVCNIDAIPKDSMILDIGPRTICHWGTVLHDVKTLIWNGPLGAFEFKPFDIGTATMARYVAGLTHAGEIASIAGGGDVVAALTHTKLIDSFTYISTAGGAFLEWVEGKTLPGIAALCN